jgi:hypothetical protein
MQHHAGIASGPEKFEGDDTASGSILAQLRERSMVLRLSYSLIGGAAQELEPLRDRKSPSPRCQAEGRGGGGRGITGFVSAGLQSSNATRYRGLGSGR